MCPLSVLYSWCSEVERWAPSLKYLRLHSPNSEEQERQRLEVAQNGTSYDIIITTYEMVKVPPLMSIWRRLHFRLCVLDEGHKIKGIDTLNAQAVRKVHCENRLLLTGTPLQNNLAELVSLLNFLIPDIFTNFKPFDDAFDITNNRIDKQKMFEAQKILDILMIRRLKEQVEKLLPKKIETKVYCPMSKQQVFWYKNLLLKDIDTLARYEHGLTEETPSATAAKKLRNLMMQMRKATLHPFLFDGAEPDIEATTLQELVAASGKLAVLDSLLRSLFVKGNRVCLFSQFTTVLDIIEDYCTMRGWNMCRFDGSTSRAKRNYLINAFNAPNSPYFIFLMSTKSGGLGTNLQSADTVVLFDSDWNPQSDLQAIARCHRIGSKNTVHVYRLISGGTIEERIVQRAEKKLLLDQMVNRGKAAGVETEDDVVSKLSATELLKDIKFGSAAVFGDSSVNTLPSKKDIEFITDRTRTESDSAGNLKGNAYHKGDSFDANQELSATQTFAGVDFAKIREEYKKKQQQTLPETMKGIAHLWDEISQLDKKREKKNRVLMVKGNGSGYGSAYVPVLASNNYELTKGESSVFGRELSSKAKETYAVPKRNKDKVKLENQGWCQYCGDGGTIYLCSRCPIAVHKECCIRFLYPRLPTERRFFSCSHHWCTKCGKSAQHAGGILFPCQACPVAFCEDCLPKDRKGFRFLGQCDRFEELGFNSTKQNVYIHCSEHCENYAITEFGWTPPQKSNLKPACPAKLDVSYNFDTAEEPQVESLDNEDTEMSDSALTASMTTSTSSPSSETGSDREGTMEKNKVKGKAVRNRTRPESRVGAIASSVKGMLFGGR